MNNKIDNIDLCIPGGCEHEFETVLLINAGGAGVVINSDDIDVGIVLFDRAHHTFADYMIGQTAERLDTNDIVDTAVGKFKNLGRQEPALTHLDTEADIVLIQCDDVLEGRRRAEAAFLFHNLDHFTFLIAQIAKSNSTQQMNKKVAAIEFIIDYGIIEAIDEEIQQTGHDNFCALA